MVDHVIYKIRCKSSDVTGIYIGGIKDFKSCQYSHKRRCKKQPESKYMNRGYIFIRQHGG